MAETKLTFENLRSDNFCHSKGDIKLISIVTAVYNCEKYLEKCITCLQNQTFRDFELILVDDGSPDGSGKLCDELAEGDSRIKVIHQANSGPGPARNAGIAVAKGDYLVFLDSDDYLTCNTALETLYNALEENNFPDALYFDYMMGSDIAHAFNRSTIPGFDEGFISPS